MTPSAAPGVLSRAHALIAAAEKATSAPWVTLPSPNTDNLHGKIVSPKGDAELGNWMVADVRWAENRAFIAAARNDAPDIARALVEVVGLLWDIARHADIPGEAAKQIIGDAARAFLAEHDGERG